MGAGILGLGGWPMGLGRRPLGAAAEATRCLGCARNRYSFASRALALAAHSLLSAIAESDRCRSGPRYRDKETPAQTAEYDD